MNQVSTQRAGTGDTNVDAVTQVARDYYDSGDADEFYFRVWGGEDIHIGIYQSPNEKIADASRRIVERMAGELAPLGAENRLLDVGAGYGGAARQLHKRFGCQVTCVNLSGVQNERNRLLNQQAGAQAHITVLDAAFEELPCEAASFDHAWSEDAILHSGDKARVFEEVARVLKPGGRLVMTDPMQADEVPDGVLGKVLARIHLDHLGSVQLYSRLGERAGLRLVEWFDLTDHLVTHYRRVREELLGRRAELVETVSPAYLERMADGLSHWVDAGRAGHLAWGILLFEKAA